MSSSAPLAGHVALVTGASRGIGRAIALELGAAGAQVVVNYASSPEAAEAVVAAITASGGQAWSHRANVADEGEVDGIGRVWADGAVGVGDAGGFERQVVAARDGIRCVGQAGDHGRLVHDADRARGPIGIDAGQAFVVVRDGEVGVRAGVPTGMDRQ